jgi:FeS assembly SUF system protein
MDDKPGRVPLPTLDEESAAAQMPAAFETPATTSSAAAKPIASDDLEKQIIDKLRTCYDPEIPVNIYELGLIYEIKIDPAAEVLIRMTLTSPACPAAGSLPGEVQTKAASVAGVKSAKVDIVWDPPWTPSRMSEAARLELGLDDYY